MGNLSLLVQPKRPKKPFTNLEEKKCLNNKCMYKWSLNFSPLAHRMIKKKKCLLIRVCSIYLPWLWQCFPFNNLMTSFIVQVREAIHMESVAVTGNWRMCSQKLKYNGTVKSLLPIYPNLMLVYIWRDSTPL